MYSVPSSRRWGLDHRVVFYGHDRILRESDRVTALDTRDASNFYAGDAALSYERHPDREESTRVIAADGELERPRPLIGVDERDCPIERVARRVECPLA